MRWIIVPPPFPLPGTEEDKFIVDYIRQDAEKIPLVKALSQDPSWKFYDPYDVISASHAPHMLTLGTLSGARGIGAFQRVFYNESGECITVIWFGGAIAGWPGVTHGGLSATVMDEALGRCAMAQFPGKSVVTAKLDLNYMKPAVTNAFYIIRVKPNQEGSTENKQWMHGRMETLDGKVCLEAKALFVVPKRFKTKSLTEG
jgi:acyl-coenzyme A thioesterase PaaI-like protein